MKGLCSFSIELFAFCFTTTTETAIAVIHPNPHNSKVDFFWFLARNVGAVTTFRTVYTKPPIIWRVETTERQVSAGKYLLLEFALEKELHSRIFLYITKILSILQDLWIYRGENLIKFCDTMYKKIGTRFPVR